MAATMVHPLAEPVAQHHAMRCELGLCICHRPRVDWSGQCTLCHKLAWVSIPDPELRTRARLAAERHRMLECSDGDE